VHRDTFTASIQDNCVQPVRISISISAVKLSTVISYLQSLQCFVVMPCMNLGNCTPFLVSRIVTTHQKHRHHATCKTEQLIHPGPYILLTFTTYIPLQRYKKWLDSSHCLNKNTMVQWVSKSNLFSSASLIKEGRSGGRLEKTANEELQNLYVVAHMRKVRNAHKILVGKPEEKRPHRHLGKILEWILGK
jgi:hypothetical protein